MPEEYVGSEGSGWKIHAVGEGKNVLVQTAEDSLGVRVAFDHTETGARTRQYFHARMENGAPVPLYDARFKEVWPFTNDASLGRVARAREFDEDHDILINEKGEKIGEVS